MAKHILLGKLRTTHTVTAKKSGDSGYFSVTNPESILIGSSLSLDGTNQINHTTHYGNGVYGLYYTVRYREATVDGTQYSVGMNYTLGDSTLAVGDTVYFDYDVYGLKIAKQNVNAETAGPKDTLFDSRIRRRGVIYAGGTQGSLAADLDFKGTTNAKDTLNYIPLVISSETKSGQGSSVAGSGTAFEFSTENGYGQQFAYKENTIRPIGTYLYTLGPQTDTNINARESDNTCTNLRFKVTRIPCAYGYMTDALFEGIDTTATDRGLVGGGRLEKDKKRVISGKFTNTTAGYSNVGGIFISRQGKDVDTCGIDDIIMGVDNGIVNVAMRGESQELASNYSSVLTGSTPQITIESSATANTTATLSFFNPYEEEAAPLILTTSGTSSYTVSTDNLYNDYSLSFDSNTNFSITVEKSVSSLALF